jgi:RNA 3'-terminal phosphate cyclase
VADGWDRLRGTVPAGGGGVRIIVEAVLSLLAITCAIVKNADRIKIMRCEALPCVVAAPRARTKKKAAPRGISREAHVRFWEDVEVKILRVTQLRAK